MKKKILFIEEGLGIGGAEKSLLTILQNFDYDKYDVDLFLFNHEGAFVPMLPREVNLLPRDEDFNKFNRNRKLAFLKFLFKGKIKKSYHSFMYLFKAAISNLIKNKQYIGWNHIKYFFDKIETNYDVAVSFLERKTFYYNIDKVKANKRIGFIHIDYHKIDYDYNMDREYFRYMNTIATVSEHCKEVLIEIFSEYKSKFIVIKNMICKELIMDMAKEKVDILREEGEIIIVTVARLTGQKGIDNAIKICKKLVDKGYKIKWYVVGKGGEKENLEKLIKDYKLQDNFFLLGAKVNPYKYIALCDIYVQPSRFEGYGITVAEAKVLCKPIVVTDIPEFKEQIINGKTGLCGNSNEMIYKCIEKLILDTKLREYYSNNLKHDNSAENKEELNKLYNIL